MTIFSPNRHHRSLSSYLAFSAAILLFITELSCTHSSRAISLSKIQGTNATNNEFNLAVQKKFPKDKFLGTWGIGKTKGTARINARAELASQIQSEIDVAAYEFAQTGYSDGKDSSTRRSTTTTAVSSSFKHGALIKLIDESHHTVQGLHYVYASLEKQRFKRVLKSDYEKTAALFRPLCARATNRKSSPVKICKDYALMEKRFKKLESLAYQLNAMSGTFPTAFRSDRSCLTSVNQIIAKNEPERLITVNVAGTGPYQTQVYKAIASSAERHSYSVQSGSRCKSGYMLRVKGETVTCRDGYLGHQCEYSPSMKLTECNGRRVSSGVLGPFKGVHPTDRTLARKRMFNNKTATNLRQIKRTLGVVNTCGVLSSPAH